jgi:NifB/MoaA-like Fe-S oxidoreductase
VENHEDTLKKTITEITVGQVLVSVLSNNPDMRQFVMHETNEKATVSLEIGVVVNVPIAAAKEVLFRLTLENLDASASH